MVSKHFLDQEKSLKETNEKQEKQIQSLRQLILQKETEEARRRQLKESET